MVFGDHHGGETVGGGGFDAPLLLPGVRSAVSGYRSGIMMDGGGGIGEPEVSWWSHAPLDRVDG